MIIEEHREPLNLESVANLMAVQVHGSVEQRDYGAWHVSNLLKSAKLISKGEYRYHEFEGEVLGIMSMGRIWEAVADVMLRDYAESARANYLPKVAMGESGILASLDGLMVFKDGNRVVETKLRFTARTDVPFDHLQQTACYCHLAGTTTVMMPVLHLTSNPPAATGEVVFLELDSGFVADTWNLVLQTKELLESRGLGPTKFKEQK